MHCPDKNVSLSGTVKVMITFMCNDDMNIWSEFGTPILWRRYPKKVIIGLCWYHCLHPAHPYTQSVSYNQLGTELFSYQKQDAAIHQEKWPTRSWYQINDHTSWNTKTVLYAWIAETSFPFLLFLEMLSKLEILSSWRKYWHSVMQHEEQHCSDVAFQDNIATH